MQYRALIQFIVFVTVLISLLYLWQRFRALNHVLGVLVLIAWVILGLVALVRAYSSSPQAGMPSFLGALPSRWRRWFLGE